MAITLFYVFLFIVLMFFALLGLKGFVLKKFKFDFCVICASISISWVIFFILYKLGYYQDRLLIGIFMGHSVVGIYYLVSGKAKENLKVFTLPFVLSLGFGAYSLIAEVFYTKVIYLLLVLWIFSFFLYYYRNNKSLKSFVDKVIECCKKW